MLAQPRASSAACFARTLPLNNWSVHQLNERPAAGAPVTACQKPHEHGPMRRPQSRGDSRESHRTPKLGSRSFRLERPARRSSGRLGDVLKQDHVETSVASAVMGTGVGKATLGAGVERVESLVDGGHGRRTAPVALARCRAPVVNCSSSAPNSLCAPRHMTPRRALVVQSRRPLKVPMGHTSGALAPRNSVGCVRRRQDAIFLFTCGFGGRVPTPVGCVDVYIEFLIPAKKTKTTKSFVRSHELSRLSC